MPLLRSKSSELKVGLKVKFYTVTRNSKITSHESLVRNWEVHEMASSYTGLLRIGLSARDHPERGVDDDRWPASAPGMLINMDLQYII